MLGIVNIVGLAAAFGLAAAAAPLPATYLRAEYLVDPLLVSTPSPRLSWVLPTAPGDRGVTQSAYQIIVTDSSSTVFDSGKVPSPQQNQVAYAGPPLAPDTTYTWTVQWWDGAGAAAPPSAPATFGTAPGDDAAWAASGAQWIGCAGVGPSHSNQLRLDFSAAPPSTPSATLTRATLYISGLGWHIPYLNGQRLSRSVFEPAFTHLRLRVLYAAHDVLRLLDARSGGNNTLAILLGGGWPAQFEPWEGDDAFGEPVWNGTGRGAGAGGARWQPPSPERARRGGGLGHGRSGFELRARAWLSLQWSDGSASRIVTSAEALGGGRGGGAGTWMCGAGALLSADIYAGAAYDARLETTGWTAPGYAYATGAWGAAVRIAEPGGAMVPAVAQPVEVMNELPPCALWEAAPGEWVFDFCQNSAGVVRLALPGPTAAGMVITLRHAEAVLHPPYGPKNGSLYFGNLRSAQATDTYTTRGDPAGETYTPLFTWHGLRYCSISGLPFVPTLTGGVVTLLHFRTAAPLSGALAFPASANTLNQLQHAIVWTQASNILGNPSDCPQRDERMGWTGDAALIAEELTLNFDAAAFLTQWAHTLNDAMHNTFDPTYERGLLPSQVPDMTGGYKADASWSSVWPSTLHALWQAYGDARIVQTYWADLLLYMDTQVSAMQGDIASITAGLGDWCPPGAQPEDDQGPKPDSHFTAGATFLVDLAHVIEMSVALNTSDTPRLRALWGTLAAQFTAAWAHDGGAWWGSSPTDGAQCAQAQAIGAGVVPAANLTAVSAYLVADIAKHSGRTSVGIIGQKYLGRALTATGQGDTAISMMLQTEYPSFGWAFNHPDEPATTLWELWNAPSEGPSMNSRAHIMQGSVGAWLFTDVAGIAQAPGSAGYASLLLWPRATTHANLTRASGSLQTIRGAVAVDWEAAAGQSFTLHATVPANAVAEVRLPFSPGTAPSALLATDGAGQVCAADAPENTNVNFACPGSAIASVTFASFGTPSGTCGGFQVGACNAANSSAVVAAACVGRTACTIAASDVLFGDPCNGTPKRFSGEVACASSSVIFSNGQYVPGVAGVTGAWVDAQSSTLSIAVGSGDYQLSLTW